MWYPFREIRKDDTAGKDNYRNPILQNLKILRPKKPLNVFTDVDDDDLKSLKNDLHLENAEIIDKRHPEHPIN